MKRYLEEFNRRTSLKERIRLLVDAMEEATGTQSMGAYLTTLFEIDALFLNQDGKISAHQADGIGFKELPGFLDKQPERPSVLLNLKEKCDAPD